MAAVPKDPKVDGVWCAENVIFFIVKLNMILFAMYLVALFIYMIKFCKKLCSQNLKNLQLLNLGVIVYIVASLANGFVQCTYEAPYSAIPHWVMIAYMMVKFKNAKKRNI